MATRFAPHPRTATSAAFFPVLSALPVGDGLADFNPVRDAMTLTGNDSDTHKYTLSEVKRLMKVLTGESGNNWKHTIVAAFTVALLTGLRLEEIKGLRWEDYDPEGTVPYRVRRP